MESARLKVHVKRKPLWEVEGAFKSGAPGEAQTIKLTQKDLEGQPLKTDEAVHCFVQSKKTSKEEPLPCVEGEFSREFTWEARAAGLFVAYVVIKNAKTFVFDNLVIKNRFLLRFLTIFIKHNLFYRCNYLYQDDF